MLRIHSFLRNIYSFIKKAISKKVYRTCAIITTGMVILAIVALSSNGFDGGGKNKISMVQTTEASSEQEEEEETEADTEAKIQTEIADLNNIEVQSHWQDKSDSNKEKLLSAKEKNRIASVTQNYVIEETTEISEMVRTVTEEEYDILLHIVAAEAGGCDLKGQILVANVIFNRVENEKFPNTIKEVVFQKNQFTPALNGTIWKARVSDLTVEAVNKALAGEDYSEGALFFSARSMVDPDDMTWFDRNLKWLFEHDGHEFFVFK